MANGEICWWEIDVPDIERAKTFYATAFGWEFEGMPGFEGYEMVKLGDRTIGAIQASSEPEPAGRGVALYVESDDLEGATARVEGAGGSVERPRSPIGGTMGWFALVRDPFGLRLGVWTDRPAA
jgi:hypothetical protein